jgi:hypothetical protein
MNRRVVAIFSFFFLLLSASVYGGCISGNCYNGKGTFKYSDGSKYTGTFFKGKPHGQGTYLHRDGSVYTGEFHHGEKNGEGYIRFAGGDEYTGHFEHGTLSGKGIMTYRKGDRYEGNWNNGKPSGYGVYSFSDGDVYTGEFLDGQFNGRGKILRMDGSYYDGAWVRNKKHGQGVVFQNGRKSVHTYDMNILTSEKDINRENDHTAVAESKEKIKPAGSNLKDCTSLYCHNETGTYRYLDGSVYTGQFVDGEGSGTGRCNYADGSYYEGGWKNHSPHGRGTMHFASGRVYAAVWDNGVPVKKVAIETTVAKESSPPVTASTQTKTSSRGDADGKVQIYALIVGIATYNHMPSLKYTDDDAYQLYAFFKSPEGGALRDDNIKILIDDAATKRTILDELESLSSRADADDVVILYLSGHGLDGAYVPSDFDGSNHQLPYSTILDELDRSLARHKLFITDACHSGSMIAAARTPLTVAIQNFYNAYNTANGGTAIMTSSKQEEVSLEYGGLRQGVFSHFLIKGLKGYADSSGDKLLTIEELYQYIYNNVREYTANKQNPSIIGDFDRNMPVGWVR